MKHDDKNETTPPWSPARAGDTLPTDYGHHNRVLDRAAAEHLREVAPHVAGSPTGCPNCGNPKTPADWQAAPPPAHEATGEMSREALELLLGNPAGIPDYVANVIRTISKHDAALRTRAREAEERAEMYVRMHRQEVVDGVARLTAAFRERDEAREQRDAAHAEANDLRSRVERLVAGAAKLAERAEEAEEEVRLADFRVSAAESRADDLLARLAAAEAEVKRLTALAPPHTVALRLDDINAAFDGPIPKDVTGSVVSRIADLRARAQRLVEEK